MGENIDNLKDILFHLEIEGTYFYQDEENKDDYFIAYRLIVIASDQDIEDCEGEIGFRLKSEMYDDYLIFTYVGENSEIHRIVGVPEIEYLEFENSIGTLLENTNIVDAVEFLKNMKTINFNELISKNLYNKKNFKNVKSNKIEDADSNKTIVEKTFHENGKIKEEIETVNDKPHGLYKLYHDNGQLRLVTRFENGNQVDGVVDSFDENGRLIRTVEIINGNKNGPFKEFYPSGTIKKEGGYKDDEIIEKPIEYYEDGGIKVDNEENVKLNFSDMKLIIKELKVETVLVDFVNNWNKYVGGEYNQLEIETIYDDLDSERDYNGELFSIVLDKENNCLFLEIDSPFEFFPLINELYNYNYLMITKSLARIVSKDFDYNLENDDYEELEYTIFSAEDSLEYDNEIVFKGGEYRTKLHISKADWDSYDVEDIDISDDFNLLKYQTIHFVSKKEFEDGNWFQTIKSFDLYDWNTYPNEF
jgi:antitoxin component YwqK of YwqJK toxin-antitoxin module